MFHVYGHVLLSNSVFVNSEVVRVQIWKEISIRIFHVELDRYLASRRRELDLRLLRTLLAFKQRARGPVGHRDLGALLCLRRCPCLLVMGLQSPHEGGSREHQGTCKVELFHSPQWPPPLVVGRALGSGRDEEFGGHDKFRILNLGSHPGFLMNSARFDKCLRRVRRTAAEPAASTAGHPLQERWRISGLPWLARTLTLEEPAQAPRSSRPRSPYSGLPP